MIKRKKVFKFKYAFDDPSISDSTQKHFKIYLNKLFICKSTSKKYLTFSTCK